MRSIDANIVVKGLIEIRDNLREGFPKQFQQETIRKALRCVEETPTLDYKDLVPQGEWERVIPSKSAAKWSTKVSCSMCHKGGYERYNFCPNCGARMRRESDATD